MPKIVVTESSPGMIPNVKSRRQLRWRIATTGGGGAETFVSFRQDCPVDDPAKCGVPYQATEGERYTDAEAGQSVHFRVAVGVTSTIYWDSRKLTES